MHESPDAVVAAVGARATRIETPCGAGRMVWRVWGDGPPLVLVHGASGSWTHWIRNVEPLARRHRVLAPDLPGYGDSDDPPAPAVESLADALAAGLDALVPRGPVDVAGFSFGGIVAGLVAARRPARVRTLVLLGPNGMGLPHAPLPALLRVPAGAPEAETREVHRENLRRLMLADPARADDLAVHVHVENLRRARFRSAGIPESDVLLRALPAVRARLAGLWGTRDVFAVPDVDARRATLARFHAGLDFRLVEGAGHWTPYEAPDAVNAALPSMLAAGVPDPERAARDASVG